MPTLKNTHLQTAPSQPANQSLQESIFYPNPRQIKNKKSSPSQKNKTYLTDKQRYTDNENEALGGNIGFAKWRVKCFYVSLVQGSSSVFQMNICSENPPLRKAEKRCR